MPIRRFPRAAVLLLCGLSAAPPSAQAAEIVVAASNPGPITGSGRTDGDGAQQRPAAGDRLDRRTAGRGGDRFDRGRVGGGGFRRRDLGLQGGQLRFELGDPGLEIRHVRLLVIGSHGGRWW